MVPEVSIRQRLLLFREALICLTASRMTYIVSRGAAASWPNGSRASPGRFLPDSLGRHRRHDGRLRRLVFHRPRFAAGFNPHANHQAQFDELKAQREPNKRAWANAVQTVNEGPGRVTMDMVEENILLRCQRSRRPARKITPASNSRKRRSPRRQHSREAAAGTAQRTNSSSSSRASDYAESVMQRNGHSPDFRGGARYARHNHERGIISVMPSSA